VVSQWFWSDYRQVSPIIAISELVFSTFNTNKLKTPISFFGFWDYRPWPGNPGCFQGHWRLKRAATGLKACFGGLKPDQKSARLDEE
jgi:hypothetical protein